MGFWGMMAVSLRFVGGLMRLFMVFVFVAVSAVPVPSFAGVAASGADDSVANGYRSGLATGGFGRGGGSVQQAVELSVAVAENRSGGFRRFRQAGGNRVGYG